MEAITVDILNTVLKTPIESPSKIESSPSQPDTLETLQQKLILLEKDNDELRHRIDRLESIFLSRDKY
tara:strand:- start:371 stop:574 length:204 start_codon:yes stop_codon:yes gene_type:complete